MSSPSSTSPASDKTILTQDLSNQKAVWCCWKIKPSSRRSLGWVKWINRLYKDQGCNQTRCFRSGAGKSRTNRGNHPCQTRKVVLGRRLSLFAFYCWNQKLGKFSKLVEKQHTYSRKGQLCRVSCLSLQKGSLETRAVPRMLQASKLGQL